MLDQALGLLDDHLGHGHVTRGGLIEGGGYDFAAHRALHLSHLFRALVDQQHDQHHIGVIGRDGMGDVLHQHGLAGLGGGHDQPALAFADRSNKVDDATGVVLFRARVPLKRHRLVGMQGRQILKEDLVLADLGRLAVDLIHLDQREIAFAVLGDAHFAFDGVAGVQVEAADLRGRDVDVVRAGQVRSFRRAQETEAVGQDLETAVTEDGLSGAGAPLEDREHQFLLAQAVGVLDVQAGGHFDQGRDM